MKSIFLAAVAAMTLASCAKDEPAATTANGKTNFVVTLPGAPSTYAVEDPQAAGQIAPIYSDVTVWLELPGFRIHAIIPHGTIIIPTTCPVPKGSRRIAGVSG